MFTPPVQRIVWKELRTQRALWIGIAAEMLLLLIFAVTFQQRFPVSPLSIALVLTGVFAMTSSAMLFAGETEARTDGFLRQLPFRRVDLLVAKLVASVLAVLAFLGFSMLVTQVMTRAWGQITTSNEMWLGDPVVYANGIAGLWAWGLFYSLVTRKVVSTIIGAAITEILVSGLIHGALADWRFSDGVVYGGYWLVILLVLVVDLWLLSRWYTDEGQGAGGSSVDMIDTSQPQREARPLLLPWDVTSKLAGVAGIIAGIIFLMLLAPSAIQHSPVTGRLLLVCIVFAVGVSAVVTYLVARFWPRLLGGVPDLRAITMSTTLLSAPLTLRSVVDLVLLAGVGLLCLVLGGLVGYSGLAFLLILIDRWLDVRGQAITSSTNVSAPELVVTFLVLMASCACLLFVIQLTCRFPGSRSLTWVRTLAWMQSVCRRFERSWGSLLWIEARRAVPLFIGGALLLALIMGGKSYEGGNRGTASDAAAWGLIAISVTSLICGLKTLLSDRSQGSLSFLHEKGVPAHRVLSSKLLVWGGTAFALMQVVRWTNTALQPILERQTPMMWRTVVQGRLSEVSTTLFRPETYLLLAVTAGPVALGMLCAAWLRRPILAIVGGIMATILWGIWLSVLTYTSLLSGVLVGIPLLAVLVALFATGSSTLLEQATWKSRLGRLSFGVLLVVLSVLTYGRYRAHEIPVVEVPQSIRNGVPTLTGAGHRVVTSWSGNPSVESLDQLHDLPQLRENLIQPDTFWSSESAFRQAIDELHLNQDDCNLDQSITHLFKWLDVTGRLTDGSRTEDGWAESLRTRRIVLAAIRRWANHPHQTSERLNAAIKTWPTIVRTLPVTAEKALASEYANALYALSHGNQSDQRQDRALLQLTLLRVIGEQERVRRLVDYYYSLSANSHVALPRDHGRDEYIARLSTTHAWAASFGVQLQHQTLQMRHRGLMERTMSATRATGLILRLQAWRLQHGQFPDELQQMLAADESVLDVLTSVDYGYESRGFSLPLLASLSRALCAGQPVLYSLGPELPHGIEYVPSPMNHVPFYLSKNWVADLTSAPVELINLARSSNTNMWRDMHLAQMLGRTPPANPHQIRFVILGDQTDEDEFGIIHRLPANDTETGAGGAAMEGGAAMGSGAAMEGSAAMESADHSDLVPVGETPPVGEESPQPDPAAMGAPATTEPAAQDAPKYLPPEKSISPASESPAENPTPPAPPESQPQATKMN